MVEQAVALNPQSLGPAAVSFYRFLIRSQFPCIKIPDFMRYLHSTYAGSTRFHQRVIYIKFATALLTELPLPDYLDTVWPKILLYGDEHVPLVRAKVVEFLILFGKQFHTLDSPTLSWQMDDLVSKYADDRDPHVLSLLKTARLLISADRMPPGLPGEDPRRLPTIVRMTSSPRIPKPGHVSLPRPPRSDVRGMPTNRRPAAPPPRLPSPVLPKRTIVVSGMTKSGSSSAVAGLVGRRG